jgi:hypothetical protein
MDAGLLLIVFGVGVLGYVIERLLHRTTAERPAGQTVYVRISGDL